jgi:predicted Fe-S protein YdhL (DUF1289 family)
VAGGAVTIPSPCTNVCTLDQAGAVCVGCWRTLDEIGRWAAMTDTERQRVVDDLKRRAERARAPRV